MSEPDRVTGIAEAELEHVRRLITEHAAEKHPWCATCQSLADHEVRCELQVRLLASEDAETGALF